MYKINKDDNKITKISGTVFTVRGFKQWAKYRADFKCFK